MKRKLFTFFIAFVVSVGTMFASGYERVPIGDLYYNLDTINLTAEVTYKSNYVYGYNEGWTIATANIPDSVEYISKTYSVTSIGEFAFRSCFSLTSVIIGKSVTSIDRYAFYSCSQLTSMAIPNNVTSVGPNAFQNCYNLAIVSIGNNVTSLGSYAFKDCRNITSVTIPNSITSIGCGAFENCSNLTSVEVLGETPATLGCATTSNYSIFKNCGQLVNIYVPCGTIEAYKNSWAWSAFSSKIKNHSLDYTIIGNVNDTMRGTVIAPTTICDNPLTAIPNYGYHFVQWSDGNTDNPRIIELTQDTTFTAEFALDRSGRCGNDSLLTWQYNPATKTLTISGKGAFVENIQCGIEARQELEKVIIGDGVTAIGTDAFADCPNLISIEWNAVNSGDYTKCPFPTTVTSVTFGANVEHIPAYLCNGINTMNTLIFPTSLKSIGEYAFKNATNIKKINIPNEVETIGAHAFDSCIFVTSIYLGYKVAEIGNYAFKGCIRVNDITCMNTTTPVVYSNTLTSISSYAYLYVPEGSKRTYRIDPYWGRFDIHEIASEDTTVTTNTMTVEANEDNAIFTWPIENNAATYSLQITKNGEVFCTLVFNTYGQLIGIAFAPGRDGQANTSAANTSVAGMSFTVTGLSSASKYTYHLSVRDENSKELVSYRGEFATTGYTGDVNTGGKPERPEGIDNVQKRNIPYTKVISNGQIYILMPNGEKYSIVGNQIK